MEKGINISWLKGLYVLLILYLIVSLGQNIWGWKKATNRIQSTEEKLKLLAYEELELKKRLTEVESDSFVETEVRNKLHLGRPGDKMVVLPENLSEVGLPESPEPKVLRPNWALWAEKFRLTKKI